MPQFVHPERGSVFLQFTVLGLIFVTLSALYSGLLNRWKGKIVGSIFIGLGLKVAFQQR